MCNSILQRAPVPLLHSRHCREAGKVSCPVSVALHLLPLGSWKRVGWARRGGEEEKKVPPENYCHVFNTSIHASSWIRSTRQSPNPTRRNTLPNGTKATMYGPEIDESNQ